MRWDEIGETPCPVARCLSVVGDRWTLLILRDAFLEVDRFEDFQRRLGCTRHLLADRLRKLVEHGILEKVQYQERPVRCEYQLTEKGTDLHPIIISLLAWGGRWMRDADREDRVDPLPFRHVGCGEPLDPEMVCAGCGERVTPEDMLAGVEAALHEPGG